LGILGNLRSCHYARQSEEGEGQGSKQSHFVYQILTHPTIVDVAR
jgi:hypothetical protein